MVYPNIQKGKEVTKKEETQKYLGGTAAFMKITTKDKKFM